MKPRRLYWTAICAALLLFSAGRICLKISPRNHFDFDYSLLIKKLGSISIATVICCTIVDPSICRGDFISFRSNMDNSFLTTAQSPFQLKLLENRQSKGWELARQKRTTAVKLLQEKGIIKVDTDDIGNQFLSLPWIPDLKLPYKSLSIQQRLTNEVCAGAFGEIVKDALLHSVDTLKTRKQAQKKKTDVRYSHGDIHHDTATNHSMALSVATEMMNEDRHPLTVLKGLYAGFPIVAAASIPQGGLFFLMKKGIIELSTRYFPSAPGFVTATLPIVLGVAAYWTVRTPAEMIKTQVQTGQFNSIRSALNNANVNNPNGLRDLWSRYPVVLQLDIPFQLINFILYGIVSDALSRAGYPAGIATRLFCGVTCGMVAAALTCPLDVGKTRIFSRQTGLSAIDLNMTSEGIDQSMARSLNASRLDMGSNNVMREIIEISSSEGVGSLFLGFKQRLLYTGLANGIRLAAYGTSRMDLMMRSLDDL